MLMEEVTCQRCQTKNEFYVEESGPHLKALCNHCHSYIKFVSRDNKVVFHFGKYKGKEVSYIDDIAYLKWVLKEVKLSSKMKSAIEKQISSFENLAR